MKKLCPKCKTELEINEFGHDRSRIDGRQRYCRACYADYMLEYRKTKLNKSRYRKTNGTLSGINDIIAAMNDTSASPWADLVRGYPEK